MYRRTPEYTTGPASLHFTIKLVVSHQVRHGRGVTDYSSVRWKEGIDKRVVFKGVGDIPYPPTSVDMNMFKEYK